MTDRGADPATFSDDAPVVLHASAVAAFGKGLLIRGAAGSGKSSLALELMALGATLVADDRTILTPAGSQVLLSAPSAIAGMIEARGLGLLRAEATQAPLSAVVDLDEIETERLPPRRSIVILQRETPLLHGCARGSFPAALMQYMYGSRADEA